MLYEVPIAATLALAGAFLQRHGFEDRFHGDGASNGDAPPGPAAPGLQICFGIVAELFVVGLLPLYLSYTTLIVLQLSVLVGAARLRSGDSASRGEYTNSIGGGGGQGPGGPPGLRTSRWHIFFLFLAASCVSFSLALHALSDSLALGAMLGGMSQQRSVRPDAVVGAFTAAGLGITLLVVGK